MKQAAEILSLIKINDETDVKMYWGEMDSLRDERQSVPRPHAGH